MAVGPLEEVRAASPGCEEITGTGVLMPALINAHCHLELSHLTAVKRPAANGQLCQWIEEVIEARVGNMASVEERLAQRQNALADQRRLGVAVIGDIGNEPCQQDKKSDEFPLIHHFQEFLAPTKEAVETAKAAVAELPDSVSATVHACYSTLPELVTLLKKRAGRLHRVFPMHVAESKEERVFIATQAGSFREFLEKRGAWDNAFNQVEGEKTGVVMYLDKLGILDNLTLCVHCVHIEEDEARLLAERGSHVCLCPRSNRFLKVGKAPLEMLLQHGVLPAVGTDSRASNTRLDIWAEMQCLREEHPGVDAKTVLAMATMGGAGALNCEGDFGSLTSGKKSIFLRVNSDAIQRADSQLALLDILTKGGRPQNIDWIVQPAS